MGRSEVVFRYGLNGEAVRFLSVYVESARLNGSLDQIELDFVEREATSQLLMKLSIQLHLAELSLSNTVYILDIFGVERARSTVHNWVHKADLQPDSGRSPDHVVVDDTVSDSTTNSIGCTLPSIQKQTNYST
jgi:hypothetical protein